MAWNRCTNLGSRREGRVLSASQKEAAAATSGERTSTERDDVATVTSGEGHKQRAPRTASARAASARAATTTSSERTSSERTNSDRHEQRRPRAPSATTA